jgi:hypothetical protein
VNISVNAVLLETGYQSLFNLEEGLEKKIGES